jgi:hypothetical protein
VLATGPNEVKLDEFNQWAAPLKDDITRVVAANLVAMLGTPQVTLFPQTTGADADFRAAIEVQNFESRSGQTAALDAVWTVRRMKDRASQTGRTTVREPVQGNGYDALAAARRGAVERGHRRRGARARAAVDSASGGPGRRRSSLGGSGVFWDPALRTSASSRDPAVETKEPKDENELRNQAE